MLLAFNEYVMTNFVKATLSLNSFNKQNIDKGNKIRT